MHETAIGAEQSTLVEDKELWGRLKEKLKSTGAGFFTMESGLEILLLKRIFTKDEARVYIALENKMELLDDIAMRLNLSVEELQPLLDGMCRKMMLISTKTNPVFYRPMLFVPGIAEFSFLRANQENDRETTALHYKYWNTTEKRLTSPFLRSVPVGQAIEKNALVAPYDDVMAIINRAEKIAVMPCACDVLHRANGRNTEGPIERCLAVGVAAEMVTENGYARYISHQEAVIILDACEEAGFIPQLENLNEPTHICHCGKNCFEILQKKLLEKPAETCGSNYYIEVDIGACTACGLCIDRCVLQAIAVTPQGKPKVDLERCLGCGLCVTKCQTGALRIKEKDKQNRYTPTETHWSAISPTDIMHELEQYKDIIKAI